MLAFTTATLLIVLVFVGIPLQFAAGRPQVANTVGTVHGCLYIVYLVVAFQLTRRLEVPKWQMLLVLAAGTVPFCAFVAERALTRRFRALAAPETLPVGTASDRRGTWLRWRHRWLSRRALLLHLAVVVVAPGCVAAGWWQATRALAGNGLSWVYSVEWPVFGLLAVGGWWHLLHEDPDARRARTSATTGHGPTDAVGPVPSSQPATKVVTVGRDAARLATALAASTGVEFVLGMVTMVLVPSGRPARWDAVTGGFYFAHAVLGVPLALGAAVLVARTRTSPRLARLSGQVGAAGVAVAGVGGLLTAMDPLRLLGMAFMLLGAVTSGFGWILPGLERLEARPAAASAPGRAA